MTEQWQELKETIIELRDNGGTGTQQEVCKFLANLMDLLEKQMSSSENLNKWIPVSNPSKELPKDRILWVTLGGDIGLVVTKLYWDMTEWSEDIVDYVLAYMDYEEPTPYKSEK